MQARRPVTFRQHPLFIRMCRHLVADSRIGCVYKKSLAEREDRGGGDLSVIPSRESQYIDIEWKTAPFLALEVVYGVAKSRYSPL